MCSSILRKKCGVPQWFAKFFWGFYLHRQWVLGFWKNIPLTFGLPQIQQLTIICILKLQHSIFWGTDLYVSFCMYIFTKSGSFKNQLAALCLQFFFCKKNSRLKMKVELMFSLHIIKYEEFFSIHWPKSNFW